MRLFHRVPQTNRLRYQPLIISLVILLSAFVPLLSNVVAEAKAATDMTPQEQAQSMSYYQVLGQCVGGNMKGTITIDASAANGSTPNAPTSSWYDNGDSSHNIYTERGQSCQAITDKALSLWGWGSNTGQFLADMGYKWNSVSHSYEGPGGLGFSNQRRDMFFNLINNRVYGGRSASLSDPGKYAMYYQAAISDACGMKDYGTLSSSTNDTYKQWATSNPPHTEPSGDYTVEYRLARIVGADKAATDHIISYNKDINSGGISVPQTYNSYGYLTGGADNGGLTQDCQWYVNGLSQYAPSFASVAGQGSVTIPGGATVTGTPTTDQQTSCKPEGIGWIICPVSNAIAKMVDGLFGLVSGLMRVEPILGSQDYQQNLQKAWGVMRNIANVAFVIAFVFIIYSQLTSMGISNYGIKKMLPRLIVAAILVNLSFYLCAVLVDISNITGDALQGVLTSMRGQIVQGTAPDVWSNLASAVLSGTALAGVGVTYVVLTNPATLWAAVGALFILMIPALLALLTAFLVLILRQALIIVLIIISPLAFVAYLLPNTESWYKKWQELFVAMLVFFPIMSLVFGGSQLAASFIMASAKTDTITGFFMYIGALAVQVIPLFIAPVLLKFSTGILGRFAGMVNNPNKGPIDALRKRTQESVDLQNKKGLAGNNFFGGIARRREFSRRKREMLGKRYDTQSDANWQERIAEDATLQQVNNASLAQSAREGEAKIAQRKVYSDALQTNQQLLDTAAGLGGDKARTKIQSAITAAEVDDFNKTVAAEKTTMSKMVTSELRTIMEDKDASAERRAAAAGQIVKTGSDNDIHDTLQYLGTQAKDSEGKFIDKAISDIQQQVGADIGGRKPLSLGAGDMSNLNKGRYDGDFASKISSRLAAGKLSAQGLAGGSSDELDKIIAHVAANRASIMADETTAEALRALEKDIAEFRTNPQLQGQQPAHEIASRLDRLHDTIDRP